VASEIDVDDGGQRQQGCNVDGGNGIRRLAMAASFMNAMADGRQHGKSWPFR
jgi:hypothetical protein